MMDLRVTLFISSLLRFVVSDFRLVSMWTVAYKPLQLSALWAIYGGHILSLFTYLLTTSVSGRVPVVLPDGYPGNKLPGYGSPMGGPGTSHWLTSVFRYCCRYFFKVGLLRPNLEYCCHVGAPHCNRHWINWRSAAKSYKTTSTTGHWSLKIWWLTEVIGINSFGLFISKVK